MNADRCLECSSDTNSKKITVLPGAATPGPHHLAKILLNKGMKADRSLEWLLKASPQNPHLKNF